ncbi:tektin-2 [Aethina tumida]|uniref:tektin-2 n=1 Tax=Aethina tumida TaxID=116153 RepID=UPI00214760DE|nr:tektin-2 [Aethina tumida]XP_049818834.1 tektin-2 [Aethina tumida]
MSVVTYEKPMTHIGLADWYAKQWMLQQNNEIRRNEAFNLRHEARQLRNETQIRTDWDTYHNNVRLSERVTQFDRVLYELRAMLERLNKEMDMLKKEKFEAERDLDALGIPMSVISECISMRDCRLGVELTYDDGDTELKKELCIVEGVKKLFVDRLQATWEKINKIEELRFKINLEISDKFEASEIDREQLNLDKNCANITFKIDPQRIVKNSVTYDTWLQHTQYIKQLADSELVDTYKFREALFVVRERARNDMIAQRDRVDFTLRKRIYETQKARNELEWQQLKMKSEMENVVKEIKTLNDHLQAKTDALKLCETRLENRSYRPGYELAIDEVEEGLKAEVLQLRSSRQMLTDKINCAKSILNALEDQQVLIDEDLGNKNQSLMSDVRCLDMRIRLRQGDMTGPTTDTDRNIQLTHMESEIPPA